MTLPGVVLSLDSKIRFKPLTGDEKKREDKEYLDIWLNYVEYYMRHDSSDPAWIRYCDSGPKHVEERIHQLEAPWAFCCDPSWRRMDTIPSHINLIYKNPASLSLSSSNHITWWRTSTTSKKSLFCFVVYRVSNTDDFYYYAEDFNLIHVYDSCIAPLTPVEFSPATTEMVTPIFDQHAIWKHAMSLFPPYTPITKNGAIFVG